MNNSPDPSYPSLRLLFWETTSKCNLKCVHCRAEASDHEAPNELTTAQGRDLLRQISAFAKPVVVLSGGEPLVREDIFELASFGTQLGLRMVLATNGTGLSPSIANRLKECGIGRISISIDGATSQIHDSFRGVPGCMDEALAGIAAANSADLPFQINTTVTRHNIDELPAILNLAKDLGASALHLFLLVPTGCGRFISESEYITPQEYEDVLNWLLDASILSNMPVKATCAPHYYRIAHQRGATSKSTPGGMEAFTKGCLAGTGVCFVSKTGEVFPCGYFPVSAGSILKSSLEDIWRDSKLFADLRNPSLLTGKCGRCEFSGVCGGCRARALAESGDYCAEEPFCAYEPKLK